MTDEPLTDAPINNQIKDGPIFISEPSEPLQLPIYVTRTTVRNLLGEDSGTDKVTNTASSTAE